ncbi:MAG: hypothetical protein WBA13_21440 [Microcoleaceae cyanobacterium]
MSAKLVPLNIPSGWGVIHNTFGDEDPIIQNNWIVNPNSYSENLLSIQSLKFIENRWQIDPKGYHLRLGWYPQSNPNGCYHLQLLQSDKNQVLIEYKSQKRSAIRQVVERCFNLIAKGFKPEQIEREIQASKRQFEQGNKLFSGSRKALEDNTLDKKNRLTYSQVGYGCVYYEITNLAYIEEKSNKMPYNTFVLENQNTQS